MFVWPHGIRFDRDGNLWITDGRATDGNGQMQIPTGKDLRTRVRLPPCEITGVYGKTPLRFCSVHATHPSSATTAHRTWWSN